LSTLSAAVTISVTSSYQPPLPSSISTSVTILSINLRYTILSINLRYTILCIILLCVRGRWGRAGADTTCSQSGLAALEPEAGTARLRGRLKKAASKCTGSCSGRRGRSPTPSSLTSLQVQYSYCTSPQRTNFYLITVIKHLQLFAKVFFLLIVDNPVLRPARQGTFNLQNSEMCCNRGLQCLIYVLETAKNRQIQNVIVCFLQNVLL
jgi:hypothetical protein